MAEFWRFPFSSKPKASLQPPPEITQPILTMDRPGVQRDLALLVPAFRRRVRRMVRSLQDAGYNPRVWETFRTPERAQYLQGLGSSKNGTKSLHCYGCAVDVICRRHGWRCSSQGCDFFEALGRAAKSQGLFWGGDLFPTFVDRPHVQAVSFKDQRRLRKSRDVADFVAKKLEAS